MVVKAGGSRFWRDGNRRVWATYRTLVDAVLNVLRAIGGA